MEKSKELLSFESSITKLYNGELSVDEYKKAYSDLMANKDAIILFLQGMKKDELLARMGSTSSYRYKNEKKEIVIGAVWNDMIMSFALGTISYGMGEKMEDVVKKKVDATTESDLSNFADEVKKSREERVKMIDDYKKALSNPETLDEYKIFINKKGKEQLTPEQLIIYDELVSGKTKEQRDKELENKAQIQAVQLGDISMNLLETVHTRDNYPLFVVKLSGRVDSDVFKDLSIKAKRLGGWYSAYTKSGAISGFQFKEKEQAEKFMELEKGDVSNIEKVIEKKEERKEAVSEKLRELGQKTIDTANEELGRERLTNTHKRASQASSSDAKSYRSKRIGETMINIADAIASGEAKHLQGIKSKTHIELLDSLLSMAKYKEIQAKSKSYSESESMKGEPATIETVNYVKEGLYPRLYKGNLMRVISEVQYRDGLKLITARWEKKLKNISDDGDYTPSSDEEMSELESMILKSRDMKYSNLKIQLDNYKRLKSMGIDNDSMLRSALREYVSYRSGLAKVDKSKQLERDIVGKKVGFDFFPTPKNTAEQMVEIADIKTGMDVLEPSAGNGNIAEVIRDLVVGANIDVIEISGDLRDILEAKGFNVVAHDFLDYNEKKYDRIVMNPPFSNSNDIIHLRHAYELLKPNGVVVAIIGAGAFQRSDRTATEFREWISDSGAYVEDLPENTFKDKSLLSTTGANAKIVKIVNYKSDTVVEPETKSSHVINQDEISSLDQNLKNNLDYNENLTTFEKNNNTMENNTLIEALKVYPADFSDINIKNADRFWEIVNINYLEKLYNLKAGFTVERIRGIIYGVNSFHKLKADTEFDYNGIFEMGDDYPNKTLENIISNTEIGVYDAGLKYPSVPNDIIDKVFEEYGIDKTPIVINSTRTNVKGDVVNTVITLYASKNTIIGYQEDADVSVKQEPLKGGYWGITTSSIGALSDILISLFDHELCYVKDLDFYFNRLSAIDYDNLHSKGIVELTEENLFKINEMSNDVVVEPVMVEPVDVVEPVEVKEFKFPIGKFVNIIDAPVSDDNIHEVMGHENYNETYGWETTIKNVNTGEQVTMFENLLEEKDFSEKIKQGIIDDYNKLSSILNNFLSASDEARKLSKWKREVTSVCGLMQLRVDEEPSLFPTYVSDMMSVPSQLRANINPYDEHHWNSESVKAWINLSGKNLLDFMPVKEYNLPKYKPFETTEKDNVFIKIHSKFINDSHLNNALLGSNFSKKGVVSTDGYIMLFTPFRGNDFDGEFKTYCHTKQCFEKEEEVVNKAYPDYERVITNRISNKYSLNTVAVYNFLKNMIDLKLVPYKEIVSFMYSDSETNQTINFNAHKLLEAIEAMVKLGHTDLEIGINNSLQGAVIYPAKSSTMALKFKTDFAMIMPLPELGGVNAIYNFENNCVIFGIDSASTYCFDINVIKEKKREEKINKLEQELVETKSTLTSVLEADKAKAEAEAKAIAEAEEKANLERIRVELEEERLMLEEEEKEFQRIEAEKAEAERLAVEEAERIEKEVKEKELIASMTSADYRNTIAEISPMLELTEGEEKQSIVDYIESLRLMYDIKRDEEFNTKISGIKLPKGVFYVKTSVSELPSINLKLVPDEYEIQYSIYKDGDKEPATLMSTDEIKMNIANGQYEITDAPVIPVKGFYIYVTPISGDRHLWVEGGKFLTRQKADVQAKSIKKMKDLYSKVEVVPSDEASDSEYEKKTEKTYVGIAYQIGREACRNNEPRVPALNKKLMDLIGDANLPVGGGVPIMESFYKGYYDEIAIDVKAQFPEMYSITDIAGKLRSGEMFSTYGLEIVNNYVSKEDADKHYKHLEESGLNPVKLEENGTYYIFTKAKQNFSDGGNVDEKYNSSASEVWNNWSESQRTHFLQDHFSNEDGATRYGKTFDADASLNLKYDELPDVVKNEIINHIAEGKYANGGGVDIPSTEKLKQLGINTTADFGDKFREWLNKVNKKNNNGKYVGYQLSLADNKIIVIGEKGTVEFDINDYETFDVSPVRSRMVHYAEGGDVA